MPAEVRKLISGLELGHISNFAGCVFALVKKISSPVNLSMVNFFCQLQCGQPFFIFEKTNVDIFLPVSSRKVI